MSVLKGEGTHTILYGPVDIYTGLRHIHGYLARPDVAGAHPTVMVLHGEGGVTSAVKSLARRLARHGMAVVAPDLYRGEQPRPAGMEGRVPVESNWPTDARVSTDVGDAFQFTSSSDTPWVRAGALGVLAVGKAADPALAFAAEEPTVAGLVLVSPVSQAEAAAVSVPVLGLLGKSDPQADAQQRLQETQPHGEWVRYGGVGAGLLDESAPDYLWPVDEDAFERIRAFFAATLGP